MKKNLLLAAFVMLGALGAYAQKNIGDYVYTATQKVKILGANLVQNGDFSDNLNGWTDAAGEAVNTEVWSVEPAAGPNGVSVLQSQSGSAADAAFCKLWPISESGGYVVMFDIKGETTTATYLTPGGSNNIDFYLSPSGSLTRAAGDDAVSVATPDGYLNDWKTIAYFTLAEAGSNLVMHMEKLTTGTQITNIQLYKAEEVFDSRVLENKLAYVDKLIATGKFVKDTDNGFEDNVVGTIRGMMDNPSELDDKSGVEDLLASYDEELVAWLNVNGADLLKDEKRWSTYVDTRKMDGIGGNWKGTGGRWFHKNNGGSNEITNDGDEIGHRLQGGMAAGAASQYYTIIPKSAGTYMFSLDVTGHYMQGTGKTVCPITGVAPNYTNDYNREFKGVTVYAGKEVMGSDAEANTAMNVEQEGQKVDCGAINNANAKNNCQRFVVFYEVSQADVDAATPINFGMTYIPDPEREGGNLGSNVNIANPQILLIGETQDEADYKNEVAAIIAQQGPLKERLDLAREDVNKTAAEDRPWGHSVLQEKIDEIQPIYEQSLTVIDAEGNVVDENLIRERLQAKKDDAEAKLYSDDLLQAVRDITSARNTFSNTNKIVTTYREQVAAAEDVLADVMYAAGDKQSLQAAIDAAKAKLSEVLAAATDETEKDDQAALTEQMNVLAEAVATFKENGAPVPFIDIDFSNDFEAAEDGYVIKGKDGKGQMAFPGSIADPNDNTGAPNDKGVGTCSYAKGIEDKLTDVLRVGRGEATVEIDANAYTENDVLRIHFDTWFLRLTDNSLIIDLRNAEDQRVAGFKYNIYSHIVGYNDFNNEENTGLDLDKYVVGNTDGDDASCADNNKTSFNLLVDYKNMVVQGIAVSPNGTCTGKPVAIPTEVLVGTESEPLSDNKIVKFVLGCEGGAQYVHRRCWFDNLKIFKYASEGTDGINTVAAEQHADAEAIFNLAGVKIQKPAQKGLYIQNGKKFVVK